MHPLKNTLTPLVVVLLLVAVGCKNTSKPSETTTDTPSNPLENMKGEEVSEVQHNFPPQPFEKKTDTSFLIDNKKFGYKALQKTIDSSMVVFVYKAMGKMVKDVYFDFEYTLKPTGSDYKGGEFLLNKHSFKKEFTEDFINHAILHNMEFLGFNEYSKEYEFKFYINQPDTDNSYVIYFFVNNKGETKFNVDDN